MASFAKIRSLYVRPIESADLTFNTSGVIGFRNREKAILGTRLKKFDYSSLTSQLRITAPGTPGRLKYDPDAIKGVVANNVLFSLRNDMLAAGLFQAISQRENAFLQKYKHSKDIVASLAAVFPPNAGANGKLARLGDLQKYSAKRQSDLATAYKSTPGYGGVVKEMATQASVGGNTVASTMLTPVVFAQSNYDISVNGDGGNSIHHVGPVSTVPESWNGNQWNPIQSGPKSFNSQETTTTNNVTQSSTTTPQEFKHPSAESAIRDERLQVDLQDEVLSNTLFSYRVPEMETILKNELDIIDLEVAKAQLRYLQTFLTSPIAGIVTAVYKDEGEFVQPGEAVLRVENDDKLLLVGVVNYPSGLKTGLPVRVSTSNVYESNSELSIDGSIVSVRGHDPDDDEWDIIIQTKGQVDDLPLNYRFDKDTTKLEVL